MSQTYVGIFVALLASVLPQLGIVEIGTDQLTTFVSILFVIAGSLWAMYGRWRLGAKDRDLAVGFLSGARK